MADPLPLFLNVDGVYRGEHLAQPWADVIAEGVIVDPAVPLPLKVGPISPAALGVQVEPGAAWIVNDAASPAERYFRGGAWRAQKEAAVQLAVDAADPTNPRIDRVVLEVLDTQFGAGSDIGRLRVVKGTAAASPVAPAEPASSVTLATVTVPAAAATIAAGNIADARRPAGVGGRVGAQEFAYVERVTSFNVSSTDANAPGVVLDPGALTYEAATYWFEFYAARLDAPGGIMHLYLYDLNTPQGRIATCAAGVSAANGGVARRKLAVTAGTHRYRIGATVGATPAGTVNAGPGTDSAQSVPAYMRIWKA